MIGACVISGNVRRSALIALGNSNDQHFITMKDYNLYPEEVSSHRWASNNSIFATVGQTDYDLIKDSIALNGEPGVVFLENIQKYSRLSDPPDYKDSKALGVNPSLRKGTKVLTDSGIYPIEELENKEFQVYNLKGNLSPAKCFLSGHNKQLWRIELENGFSYYCTEEHKWPILNKHLKKLKKPSIGKFKKLSTSEIQSGMLLPCPSGRYLKYIDGEKFFNYLYAGITVGKYLSTGQIEILPGLSDFSKNKINEALLSGDITTSLSKYIWNSSTEFRYGIICGIIYSNDHFILKNNCLSLDLQELFGFFNTQTYIKDDKLFLNQSSCDSFKKLKRYPWWVGEQQFIMIKSVEKTELFEDVWDINVMDDTHCFTLSQCITGNCGEQSLESTEMCVSGDTRIQTRNGCLKIADVVDKEVEVWNSAKWSKAKPRITGHNRELYRVNISDGSHLDCTSNHGFPIKYKDGIYLRTETKDLKRGDILQKFELGKLPDVSVENISKFVQMLFKMYSFENNFTGKLLEHTQETIEELQLLFRRIGINHTVIEPYDDNKYTLWVSNETLEQINRRKISPAVDQSIVSVEKLSGLHTTYCFEEPELHMGVFNNVLTFQCNLVETFPSKHSSFEEFQKTLKFAYLYAKTVTLLPTHWPETNAIMMKNRRIGLSQSGIVDAFVRHGRREMFRWCDEGYKYLRKLDNIYSDWLCIPKSIKITSVKPSGSVSLLPGVSPGIHYPHSEYYIRRIRVATNDPLVDILKTANYHIEKDLVSQNTSVVSFPIHEEFFDRKKDDVSIWEQVQNCADYQKWWADNNVSITVTFRKDEAKDIPHVLRAYEDVLKAISFLPISGHGYQQAPYEEINKETYEEMSKDLGYLDFSSLINNPLGEKFCDGDTCLL